MYFTELSLRSGALVAPLDSYVGASRRSRTSSPGRNQSKSCRIAAGRQWRAVYRRPAHPLREPQHDWRRQGRLWLPQETGARPRAPWRVANLPLADLGTVYMAETLFLRGVDPSRPVGCGSDYAAGR